MSGGRAALFLSNYIVDRKFFNIEKRAGVIKCYPVFRLLRQKSIAVSVTGLLSMEAIEPVEKFHLSLPMYQKTPLVALPGLANQLGVRNIFIITYSATA
jgi:hypothetical protein